MTTDVGCVWKTDDRTNSSEDSSHVEVNELKAK